MPPASLRKNNRDLDFATKYLLTTSCQAYAASNSSDISPHANLFRELACAQPLKKHRQKSSKFWASPYAIWG